MPPRRANHWILFLTTALLLAGLWPRAGSAQEFGRVSMLNLNAAIDGDASDLRVDIAGRSGAWVAVWASNDSLGGTIEDDFDILVARSSGGYDWTAPEPLANDAANDFRSEIAPTIATDGLGTWIAAWDGNTEILVARSTDAGVTWTDPATIAPLGPASRAQIATDGAGSWLVVWLSTVTLGGTIGSDVDLLFSRSTDAGATWSPPAALNTNADSDFGPDEFARVDCSASSTCVAVWESEDTLGGTIGSDEDVLFARSTDGGATWSDPEALYAFAATDADPDRRPDLATDGAGNWVVVWNSSEPVDGSGTDADILSVRSTDDAATWEAPALLNSYGATDDISDLRARIASDGAGNWLTIWVGADLGAPVVIDLDIIKARSDDAGATWSAFEPLSAAASTDGSAHDNYPALATDGLGAWTAAWSSNSQLPPQGLGKDNDILYATQPVPIPAAAPSVRAVALALLLGLGAAASRRRARLRIPFRTSRVRASSLPRP